MNTVKMNVGSRELGAKIMEDAPERLVEISVTMNGHGHQVILSATRWRRFVQMVEDAIGGKSKRILAEIDEEDLAIIAEYEGVTAADVKAELTRRAHGMPVPELSDFHERGQLLDV